MNIAEIQKVIQDAPKEELAKLADMTSGWATPHESKFHYYQPNPVLLVFHESEAKTRAVFGGNRSGKTYGTVVDVACGFTGKTPKSLEGLIPKSRLDKKRRIRYCMADYPNSFSKVIWPTIKQIIPDKEIADVVKDSGRIKAIVNDRGGFVEFMQYDQDLSKFPGASRHEVVYDEEPPEAIRDENLMRIVDTDGEEIFSLTPIDCALRWIYDEIYLKAARVVEKVDDKIIDTTNPAGQQDIHVFFASIYDNHVISPSAADRILSKFPEEERIVREKGHFLFRAGLVYKGYSDSTHLIDWSPDWYEGRNRDDYTLYIAIDPHPRTPHAVLFYCVRRDGLSFIVDELYEGCTAPMLVELIKQKCHGKRPELIIIDPIASTPDPSTKSCFLFDIASYGLDDPIPHAASKDKDRGIILCQQKLEMVNKVPGLYVMRNCERFRYEITRYVWDEWKRISADSKGPKQKPVDKDDHMMENWYRIENLEPDYTAPYEDEPPVYGGFVMEGRNATTGY